MSNLFITQGISHIQKFHQHWGTRSITDNLLRVSFETCLLEVGIGRNLFSLDFDRLGKLVTDGWIKHLWEFCSKYGITITDRVTEYPPLSRERDVFLMEVFANEDLTKDQLIKLNNCRKYLEVMTLSDIMDGYGTCFTQCYKVIKDDTRVTHYNWPNSVRPGSTAIKLWKSTLRKVFGLKQGKTEYSLGKWLHSPTDQWLWHYSTETQLLYQRFGKIWKVWKRITRGGQIGATPLFKYSTNALSKPHTTIRATVKRINIQKVRLTGWKEHENETRQGVCQEVLHQHLPITLDDDSMDSEVLKEAFRMGTIVAVSDGSYRKEDNAGAAAWVLASTDDSFELVGSIPSPGEATIQNSFRSELVGIMGLLMHIESICTKHQITAGSIEIHCDGESAIKRLKSCSDKVSNKSHHFDIINSILTLKQRLPIQVTFHHVKGHQDQFMPYWNLNKVARLNVKADRLAKEALQTMLTLNQNRSFAPIYSPCEILVRDEEGHNIMIRSKLTDSLKLRIQGKLAREYWVKKKHLEETKDMIDWKMRNRNLNNLPLHLSRWMCKFCSGFCGTGKMLEKYKYQNHSRCPRCNKPEENTRHVLQCMHDEAPQQWEEEIKKLEEFMTDLKISPDINKMITTNLHRWRTGHKPTTNSPDNLLSAALTQQSLIGWHQFIEGFWSKRFLHCQERYQNSIKCKKSATLTLMKVQRRIWMIAWTIWTNRNTYLHKNRQSIHPQEEAQLNEEITYEHTKGQAGLTTSHKAFFNQPIETILAKTLPNKINWLYGIWAAREMKNPAYLSERSINNPNPTLRFRYVKWKEKILI